jgi:hypothetical protein
MIGFVYHRLAAANVIGRTFYVVRAGKPASIHCLRAHLRTFTPGLATAVTDASGRRMVRPVPHDRALNRRQWSPTLPTGEGTFQSIAASLGGAGARRLAEHHQQRQHRTQRSAPGWLRLRHSSRPTCHETFRLSDSRAGSIPAACSVMLAVPALSAFAIFHRSERAEVAEAEVQAALGQACDRHTTSPGCAVNDIRFLEATQGPCFRDLHWETLAS